MDALHPTSDPTAFASMTASSVVVADDGSSNADQAVAWAADQASAEGRRLVVVTIGDGSAEHLNSLGTSRAAQLAPDVEVIGLTARGDPRITLVELSQHAHILVLGSRGRGSIRSMLLGSVSAAVSRLSFCPVVVCRGHAASPPGRGVLVGVDGTPECTDVLDFAFEQASLRGQDLTVVHCVWDVVAAVAGVRSRSIDDTTFGDADDDDHRLLAEVVAGCAERYPDVTVTRRVAQGLVDDVLGGRTNAWDLVVVGRHPMDTLERVVGGSMATAILERAHTTVAVVPSPRTPVTGTL